MSQLIDKLGQTDAIEVDGVFIRHFSMESEDSLDEDDDDPVLIDIEFVDGNCDLYEFAFTRSDLESAVFDPDTQCWQIGSHEVGLFKVTAI